MKTLQHITVLLIAFTFSVSLYATGVLYATSGDPQNIHLIVQPTSMTVNTTIREQIATTSVRERFARYSTYVLGIEYGFPLPSTASVTGVRLWIDTNEYVLQISGSPADTTHSSGTGGSVSNSALQKYFNSAGYTQTCFRLPIMEKIDPRSTVTVELNYIELLPYTQGLSSFNFPLRTLQNDIELKNTAAPESFRMVITLATGMELDTAWSPSHPQAHVVKEKNNVGLTYNIGGDAAADSRVTTDFNLQFRVAQKDIQSSFFSNKPSNEDGHFVFLLRPSIKTDITSVLSKTFTFIIDVSGSMTGSKIEQAKGAAAYCVSNLNPQDRFNVIAFSSTVGRFQPAPIDATPSNINFGLNYISSLYAGGGTALQDAAMAGLAQYNDPTTVNIIIFLTDGIASLDQTVVQKANTNHVRICVFGVGTDVNSQQLSQLAALNNGLAKFITETDQTAAIISSFYNQIRYPVWRNLTMSIAPVDVYDVLPTQLPDMNVGEQVTIAGRYKQPGDAVITIHAFTDGQAVDAQFPVHFSADSTNDVFSPKIWARMRIDYLKSLMAKETQNSARWNEWRAEIVRLGLRYGIVTEFTTYKDTGTVSDVEELGDGIVTTNAAFPNPFVSSTTISFTVDNTSSVSVIVYDMQGREIRQLLQAQLEAGAQSVQWDGLDDKGQKLSAGVYLCVVRIGGHEHIIRLNLL